MKFEPVIYRFADCALETASRRLTRGGEEVAIEPQVFDLLQLLLDNRGRLVNREEMVDAVWNGRIVSESAISARIAAARRAVGDDGKRQQIIRTHHGRGLELTAEVETTSDTATPKPDDHGVPKVRYALSARGRSLAYLVSGSGPPLFQIEGPPVSTEKAWHIPILRDGYKAYREGRTLLQMDWAGTGLSEALDSAQSVEQNVEDMLSVAEAAGVDRFDLLCESGACMEAVTLAAMHPEKVCRMVIVGGYAEGRVLRAQKGRPEALKTMIEAGWDHLEGGLATAFLTAYFPDGPADAIPQMVGLMQQSASREYMLSLRDKANAASTLPILGQVRCPTLIVQGRNDAVHPLHQAQKLAAGIPDAELLVLESGNHLVLPGHPTWDEFLLALRSFLDG